MHLDDFLEQEKHEKGHMREDESRKFYFLDKKWNQRFEGEGVRLTEC